MKCGSLLLLLVISADLYEIGFARIPIEDKSFWYGEGATSLKRMLEKKRNLNEARNVIIFVGDGMGIATVTAARIYSGQLLGDPGEEHLLSFDQFPDVGLIKTYNVDKQVPDSAGTGTAIFTGVKTNYNTIGLDATTSVDSCDPTLLETAKVTSIMDWAQHAGKYTGIVTTTRITHATPATTYAHSTQRDWECETEVTAQCRDKIKDIARQLVEDEPGNKFKVIFGGGLHQLGVENSTEDTSCKRADGRNLAQTWLDNKEAKGLKAKFIRTTGELNAIKPEEDDYVLGLFGYGHMPYNAERDRGEKGAPSLTNMTVKAIQMLQKGKKGFVLMVEGGRIDHAHHENYARLSLLETLEFDSAIKAALEMTSRDDTLIIVTADHSHTMTFNGYPERGNDILGFAHNGEKKPQYETLTYANGPGYSYHKKNETLNNGDYLWKNLTDDNSRGDLRYRHFAPIHEKSETHGGEDIAVYANGPFSHLFNGVHEQSYIAHAISCAGRFGPATETCGAAHSLRASLGAILLAAFITVRNFF